MDGESLFRIYCNLYNQENSCNNRILIINVFFEIQNRKKKSIEDKLLSLKLWNHFLDQYPTSTKLTNFRVRKKSHLKKSILLVLQKKI